MSTLPIRVFGDPVLATPTLPVIDIDGRLAGLVDSMIETMYDAPGVGLAANQVGINRRLFVYDKGEGPLVVINPVLVESAGTWVFEEGCLSIPGHSWEIERPNEVHVRGFDLEGNELDMQVDEFEGRILQHELDHLDGILLVERLDPEQRREAKRMLRQGALRQRPDPDGLRQLLDD